jgi:DNA-damage-inducible protein J
MSTIQVRTQEKTKKTAQRILADLGLDLSSAINIYLLQIIKHGGIPFEIITENGMTPEEEREILQEIASAKRKKGYTSVDAMHRAILGK